MYQYDISTKMTQLLHIRVGKEMKEKMQELIGRGLFSSQTEIAREALRAVILKYKKDTEDKK